MAFESAPQLSQGMHFDVSFFGCVDSQVTGAVRRAYSARVICVLGALGQAAHGLQGSPATVTHSASGGHPC